VPKIFDLNVAEERKMELGSTLLWGLGIVIAAVLIISSVKKNTKNKDHRRDDSTVDQSHHDADSHDE